MGSKHVRRAIKHKCFGTKCSAMENCLCCKYPSPVKLNEILPLLNEYPKKSSAKILIEGFTNGFKLGYSGNRISRESPNLKSINDNPKAAFDKINKEVNLNRIAGPFISKPLPNLIVSPIGLVPKAEPGKFRLIQHLSHPLGGSVNDGIDRSMCYVHYTNFDDAVKLVVGAGKGALMAKTDIESAFRLLPVHPSDFHLLGMKLDNLYYVDKALPMGASCSPALFETFSTFLEWVVKKEIGIDSICHYADDFLLVSSNSRLSCSHALLKFKEICHRLGVPLAEDKTVGPTSNIVFLGLQIDSELMTISIPLVKITAIIDKIKDALKMSKITLRQIQSLIGSLSFVCKAISPGRAFLRRLIDLTRGVTKPWFKIRLTAGAKSDLNMWLVFLRDFNGVSIIPDQRWYAGEDLQLFTDASGEIGFGGFFQGKWFQGKWLGESKDRAIAWKEFFPIVVAIVLWGGILSGKRIILRCDNEGVVAILNRQTSKCPEIMNLVRFFVLQCLRNNVSFHASHISGVNNNVADALSRFQMGRFWAEVPTADSAATPVPEFIWHL